MSVDFPWEAAFARNVKAARERRGWSQSELARKLTDRSLPFHQQQVQRIEVRSRPVRLNEAILLAEVLGESFDGMTHSPDSQTVRGNLEVAASRVTCIAREVSEYAGEQVDHIDRIISQLNELWAGISEPVENELSADVRRFSTRASLLRDAIANLKDAVSQG